ncbi:SDR family oxidoreductase [Paenibacillus rigui]|uniref:Short-chain dehydrogenase n=1 Tax=Paenibacillus rigui TaxID=554312 RepID=A0A229UGA2_9BACL|nr:SDR family oxidoreductase [Paenibacillus rigui]OXM82414.1 short-chain dehydrogenase [Paenibacillus rigui]
MNKVIAITGASSGIGLATALLLAQHDWIVYAGTRDVARDQQRYAGTPNLHFVEMEVTRPETLRQAFDTIERTHGHMDALFSNAGFGFLRALGQASMDEIKRVFETNVFGVMHSIQEALPLLRKAPAGGHVIATTSVGGLVGQPFNEIYCSSKFAVEGLLESLATYYKPLFNIDVTLLEPGAIATQFNSTVFRQLEETGGIREDEYKPLIDKYIDTFSKRNTVPQTPESVAEVVLKLLQMETKPLRLRTSDAAERFAEHKTKLDPTGLDGTLLVRKLQLNM